MSNSITKVAVVGTGVIGASWSALFLARGLKVTATDPAPGAETILREYIANAWPALEELGLAVPAASPTNLTFTKDLAEIADVDFVQENGPERLAFKQSLYHQLDELLAPEVLIATSSSGLMMTEIQKGCALHPERCLVGHPFNPPHLIPLVELVAGERTSPDSIKRADAFYTALGKRTIRLNKEVPGHVANRLQGVLIREVMSLVNEGVVTVADADTACSWGPGLRWGVMGPVLLNHLGGGSGGIEHFYQQFAGPLVTWWTPLGEVQLNPEMQKKIVDGLYAEVDGRNIEELACERDRLLMILLKARLAAETVEKSR
ncbi:TPA: 3-hydroxyacyl-CoA dehydrogenase [Pseudomonas aeruginosa]|uniref:3-hydroxyacyl-CoA dehydrogenase NAD-binding domain-containing protein n=1 Tax=Pseudomonas aeruginosa group TaxID=136841 RepID=UPI00071B2B9A|nr:MULTISPECIES: 3-hydroxyacyl-CoA dehydrogenase NAD-binding domain-containing protein [Pseudomonas aeruginosa group]KSC53120.1 3-hydroxyacyl-CoA dehydrogenase [Pseudomonas paraeruginosa]KSL20601.1 3-hydroxyacyl-CoA dehydrogenase [Pseudomonas aeruginosa]MBH8713211.1 3-hydroxyacyl-CoA dehydrogenase [Pseudomonas aeruginosa]MBH9341092.1 3-hydroxyacyl-CoA dehydrogenase [Pseudomonas aeruginosa]MBH9395580.1 3-hydroxyacyl-CoA dehydrogenase [Pseudomonas aeruginosa]